MQTKTILVADDDLDEIELYQEAIFYSSLPITINAVCSCDAIFEAIKTEGIPDMLIVDGHMPNYTLDQCISAIRSDPHLLKTPLIVLSGTRKSDSLINYYNAGINLYLTKPYSMTDIENIFCRLYNMDWSKMPVLTPEEFYK